jgi:hypothetical protein
MWCPSLFVPTADDDVFYRFMEPTCTPPVYNPKCLAAWPWHNMELLGDAGGALVDPAQPQYVVVARNGNFVMLDGQQQGALPTPSASHFHIEPANVALGLEKPGLEYIKQVMTMPNESPLTGGDYLAIVSAARNNANNCRASNSCPNDQIVRNLSAIDPRIATTSWKDVSPSAQFAPGTVLGIYPSGGSNNLTVYVLTDDGKVSVGTSTKQQPIAQWTPVMGSGTTALIKAGNVFVNPYDPAEIYAIDLGDSTIKSGHPNGSSWTPIPTLHDIATNNGEFDFGCPPSSDNYGDKEIFGNDCSMTHLAVSRDAPGIRFATLYPGGVAFSRDSGKSWISLDVTNADPANQPIELPNSAWYDARRTVSGDTSVYIGLAGKGVKRIDGPFATLTAAQIGFCPKCLKHPPAKLSKVEVSMKSPGAKTSLKRGADGNFRGTVLFDSAKTTTLNYSFVVDGTTLPAVEYKLSDAERRSGVATIGNLPP